MLALRHNLKEDTVSNPELNYDLPFSGNAACRKESYQNQQPERTIRVVI